jgi:M6 family metalloprotease-like protein
MTNKYQMKRNKIFFITGVILLSFFSQSLSYVNNFKGTWKNKKCIPGNKNWLVIRVEFQEDSKNITTGTGKFLQQWEDGDTSYVFDPVPHNRQYFQSHLKAINNYWSTVTNNKYSMDTSDSQVLPLNENPYTLDNTMRYYNPASDEDSVDFKLAEFVYDVIKLVSEEDDYPTDQSEIIIYHAGVGQDFDFSGMFDPSPYDIPSFYFDENFLSKYLPNDRYLELINLGLNKGIVVPEMQNQLDINIGLHGTEILLSGYLLGLPALYDTETGKSKAGVFGLMDQGSNNANGLVPIKPSAFERILLGIQKPIILDESNDYNLLEDNIYKIPINSTESFLIEYRKNSGIFLDSLYSANEYDTYIEALKYVDSLNSIDLNINANGVLIGLNDYDITLQTDGLLIWHINDPFYEFNEMSDNPNGGDIPMLRLEEADGGYDIGKNYGSLSSTVNQGWKWDIWFDGNEGYFDNNSSNSLKFSDGTNPNTRTFTNLSTGISITDFNFSTDTVSITLNFSQSDKSCEPNVFYKGIARITPFDADCLFGVKDSFIIIKNGNQIFPLFKKNKIINPNKTYLYPLETGFLEIENGTSQSSINSYNYVDSSLSLTSSQNVNFIVDLENISIIDDVIFIPPIDSTKNPAQYNYKLNSLEYFSGSFLSVDKFLPINISQKIYFIAGNTLNSFDRNYSHTFDFNISTIINFNDTLIIADKSGGYYYFEPNTEYLSEKYASAIQFKKIIPVHLNYDGECELIVTGIYNDRNIFAILSHYGYFENNFPIFKNYEEVRVTKDNDQFFILAMNEAGDLDEYSIIGTKLTNRTAPSMANSFFLDKFNNENVIVSDGTIWTTEYDSIYWGYSGNNLQNTNRIISSQNGIPVNSNELIRDGLIYNYPNPIENGRTKFRYFAIDAEQVDIYIYELTGKFVQQLSQTPKQNQLNEVKWNVNDLQSGVYIARIKVVGNGVAEEYFIKPAVLK